MNTPTHAPSWTKVLDGYFERETPIGIAVLRQLANRRWILCLGRVSVELGRKATFTSADRELAKLIQKLEDLED